MIWRTALLLAATLLALPAARTEHAMDVSDVREAAFLKSDAPAPDDGSAQPWETRRLPDLWRTHGPSDAGFGWYRVAFDARHQPDTPWALRVAWANSALAVRLNGSDVWREPAFDAVHLAARASPPYLVVLPPSLLVQGRNVLDIHLRVERDINAGLSVLEVGPQELLAPRHAAQRFWRSDLPRALNLAALVAAVFVGLLWLRRPTHTLYPWFCALALTWALRALYYTGDDGWLVPLRAPLGLRSGDFFLAASLSLGFVLLAIVVNRFAGQPRPAAERVGLALCVAAPLAIAPLGHQVLAPLRPAWWALAVVFGAWAAVAAARLAWQERHWSYALILAGIAFMASTGLHDWGVVAGHLAYSPLPWLSYGPPLMIATIVAALGGRYFQALDETARLNADLEQRVRDKTLELERHYERIAQLESAAAVAGERDRLMRDMHDGVGSQLITLQHALEKGGLDGPRAATLVRECVDDLRLVIDSLDTSTGSMNDALANLRFRLEPRLSAAGIASAWDLQAPDLPLAPGVVLQLLRILQEALTNALKHSGAGRVQVQWAVDASRQSVRLLVRDDGTGLAAQAGSGRGLGNMRLRAQRIGAVLDVSGDASGTTVAASLPLAAGA